MNNIRVENFLKAWDNQYPSPRLVIPDQLPRLKWVLGDAKTAYDDRQRQMIKHEMNSHVVAKSVTILQQWLQLRNKALQDFIETHNI